jgi:hypothetical protein
MLFDQILSPILQFFRTEKEAFVGSTRINLEDLVQALPGLYALLYGQSQTPDENSVDPTGSTPNDKILRHSRETDTQSRGGPTHKIIARKYLVLLEAFVRRETVTPRIFLFFLLDETNDLIQNGELRPSPYPPAIQRKQYFGPAVV